MKKYKKEDEGMNIIFQITEEDMQKGTWVLDEVGRLAGLLSGALPEKPVSENKETAGNAERETITPEQPNVPAVDENYRVEVRKTLAELNKKAGKNIASELIKGFGAEKLTEVTLTDLPALMEKAKEALSNAG